MKKSVILERYSSELADVLQNDRFDVYSYAGKRKLAKISKKYKSKIIGADEYLQLLEDELKKREQLEENMRYSGTGKYKTPEISQEEFLRKEQDKTWVYRSKIE